MPTLTEVFDRAVRCHQQGDLAQAAALYHEMLRADPKNADVLNNLGLALAGQKQLAPAVEYFRQALRLNPEHARAYYNLGNVLKECGLAVRAIECYHQALRVDPQYIDAHTRLGAAFVGQGALADALVCFERALRIDPDNVDALSCLVFSLQYHPGYAAPALLAAQRCWEQALLKSLPGAARDFTNEAAPARRLRVGYVSTDFRDHVVGRNIWPLLAHRDPTQFEVTLYASLPAEDGITRQFRDSADRWRAIATLPDAQVAKQIQEDGIDILVDLTLHTGGNRLAVFARKPAPVQVAFAAYPGGTGLRTIDYRLTDPYLDPPGLFDGCFVEASFRLPHSFWCYEPLSEEPPVASLPYLEKGFITFGCLNNPLKVNEQVLQVWAQVLHAVAGSRLLLLTKDGGPHQQFHAFMAQQGIDPARVTFATNTDRPQYLALYHRIDIGLDTFPYNGHTTSLDSFWMGVPVITLVGRTVAGRGGVSQLTNLGLTELVAETPADFVRLATALAADTHRLRDLRLTLRARMKKSPLMDAPGFTRGIEDAYRTMWRQWCSQATTELFNAALTHHQTGARARAEGLYRQILQANPSHADAHNNLGNILGQTGRLAEAAECFRNALRIDADHANAHYNLGTALAGQDLYAEAVDAFRQALRLNSARADARQGLAQALTNLGNKLGWQGRIADAADCYRQALAAVPDHAMALWNQALLRLQQGDFESGWRYFHLRETLPGMVPRSLRQPRWDGAQLAGRSILIYTEKGFGDVLQMVRYLPLVKKRGGKVILECQPALVPLLTGIVGADQVIAAGADLPHFDVEVPLFNLPCIFGTTLATIPAQVPYLHADAERVRRWRDELTRLVHPAPTADGMPLKILGIVWQASPLLQDYDRNIPLACFEPLARIPGMRLVSLQKGPGVEQLRAPEKAFPILDLGDKLDADGAFLDTAAIMRSLDLVIAPDTAANHLAGALGVPVWTALAYAADWRWLLERSDSPWYPTMRLFRQRRQGDWCQVFERIAQELSGSSGSP